MPYDVQMKLLYKCFTIETIDIIEYPHYNFYHLHKEGCIREKQVMGIKKMPFLIFRIGLYFMPDISNFWPF